MEFVNKKRGNSISDSYFEWGSEHAGPEPAIWPHGQEQPEARAEAVLDKGVLGALEMVHMDSFKTYP